MARRLIGLLTAGALLALGCASAPPPDPEPPVQLRIQDFSAYAPPPPPPAAPPGAELAPADSALPAPPAAAPQPLPTNVNAAPAPSTPPPAAAPPPATTPPLATDSANWTYSYPSGHWVYANGYGWIWVPANTVTVDDSGVPYAYLYTPSYGWTWYVSPWGAGGYHYGGWVRRPWHPVGWHGVWVAHPSVVVRLG
ncbi:MAG TPA: hypothetical protein VGJ91_19555, partial [Polyangiaceae bacterium]